MLVDGESVRTISKAAIRATVLGLSGLTPASYGLNSSELSPAFYGELGQAVVPGRSADSGEQLGVVNDS